MICSSENLLFFMSVLLQFDGLYEPQLGTASGGQVNYDTLKFNARAVYQMYYGWFDGHPVNLDPM